MDPSVLCTAIWIGSRCGLFEVHVQELYLRQRKNEHKLALRGLVAAVSPLRAVFHSHQSSRWFSLLFLLSRWMLVLNEGKS
jgi:hypothetical protein